MRTPRRQVVKGKTAMPQPEIGLDDEDRVALDEAVAATSEGKLIPLAVVRTLLRSL